MSLLPIKKSTLNLKRSILRQAHRFSSTQQSPSLKKHNQEQQPTRQEQQLALQKNLPRKQSILSLQRLDLFDIFVIESTTFNIVFDEKYNRHEKKALALFNIIIDDDNKHISLFRFESDIIALEQLLKKHYGEIPSLPVLIDTTNTSITASTLTSSLVRNLTLRRLFTKSKAKKINGENVELWLRSCATHPILSRSTQLLGFLSPQREHDTVTTKPTRPTLSQHQRFLDPATAMTIGETPITLPINLPLQQQQLPTHHIDQHSLSPIHSLTTTNEYALPSLVDTQYYYDLDDSILDLSSIVSLCLDSIGHRSGTTFELDEELLEDNDSDGDNGGNEDINSNNSYDPDDNDDDDIGLYELAPLLPSPPLETSLGLIDDLVAPSDANPPSTTQQMIAHPLLMSSTKLAPSLLPGRTKTHPPSKHSSMESLSSTTYQHANTAKKPQQTSRMTFDEFQCLKVLGKGCMGKVILVRHHLSARLYALKAISKEWVLTQREIAHTMMERNILSKVSKTNHPFLIKLHHAFQNANQLFLVMDYHVGSDLATQLQLHYCFDADRCRFYIAEILLGLQELHRLDILYRDLKPENILLAADGHIVLTDFGFSRLFDQGEENQLDNLLQSTDNTRQPYHTRTFCGTVEYMAAEMYLSEEYTFAVDYWSLGIILYEMLLGYTPFDADNDAELYRRVLEDPIDIPDDMPHATADLILGLLERDPSCRLGCAQFYDDDSGDSDYPSPSILPGQDDLRHHPYFYPLDWSDVYHQRLVAPYVPHIKSETDVSHFDPDFVKLSPRLSVPCRHDDFDDDDPFDIDPDIKMWTNTQYDDGAQQHLDDAFAGYSYINESTCLDTDSLLNEDVYQYHQYVNDSRSAPSMIMDTESALSGNHALELKGSYRTKRHYYGFACTAVTTPTTVTSTVLVTAASTQYHHHHTTAPEQLLSSFSSPIPYSTNPQPTSSSR